MFGNLYPAPSTSLRWIVVLYHNIFKSGVTYTDPVYMWVSKITKEKYVQIDSNSIVRIETPLNFFIFIIRQDEYKTKL